MDGGEGKVCLRESGCVEKEQERVTGGDLDTLWFRA